jgi:hypothetical protein
MLVVDAAIEEARFFATKDEDHVVDDGLSRSARCVREV